MSKEHTACRDLMLWLCNKGSSVLQRRGLDSNKLNMYESLLTDHRQVNEKELGGLLKSEKADLLQARAFVYLEPIDKGGWMLPVLSLNYDFSGNSQELRLRLALFLLSDGSRQTSAIGFRFETSEGTGKHDYCHAQLITRFDKSYDKALPCPDWFPESQPAFPLDAHNPVQLLACMVVSLYGPSQFRKDILPSLGEHGKQFIGQMACLKAASAPIGVPPADATRPRRPRRPA